MYPLPDAKKMWLWILEFIAKHFASEFVKRLLRKTLSKNILGVVKNWTKTLPESAFVSAETIWIEPFTKAASEGEFPCKSKLHRVIEANEIPSKELWFEAFLERWRDVRDNIQEPQPFFCLEESKARKELWRLAEATYDVCAQHESIFKKAVIDKLDKIIDRLPASNANDVVAKSIIATSKIIEQWQGQIRSDPKQLINIEAGSLDDKGKPTGQSFGPSGIASLMSDGRRVVLKGSPGAGKTTTLVQIAELLLKNHNKVPLLISLWEWAESKEDILTFISKHPVLAATGVSSSDIALLHEHGRLAFLFNGWNEVDPNLLAQVGRQLLRVDREFTAAGIIVASRENYVIPPMINRLDLLLQPLDDTQRRTYIRVAASKDPDKLVSILETNRTLSEITRTPLFLSEIVQLYNNGAQIPNTKYGVLQCAIARAEQSPEHSTFLQADPLSGRTTQNLSALAFAMTESGRVGMHYDRALTVVNEVNKRLLADGQIVTIPEPKSIVDTLCAHHLLEKSVYPVNSIHFVHQQFQEFYAATRLRDELAKLCAHKDENAIRSFRKDIINIPVWEEPLKLLAEEISALITEKSNMTPYEVNALVAGFLLAKWTIFVDPVFAAELVRILGEAIWNEVKSDFAPLLRKWYECSDENHKACALAAMFATGTDSFGDIIWPLLEHEDHQIRLKTYRTAKPFMVSCLGDNWQNRINSWDEDRRTEFLSELSFNCTVDATRIFEYYAQKDPSPKVKVAAINAVGWYGPRSKFYDLVSACDNETFKIIIKHDYILNKFPDNLASRALECYRQLLKELNNSKERLRLLLKMYRLCKPDTISLLKKELENFQPERRDYSTNDFLKVVACEDPKWVSQWVCQQVAHGNLYYDHYSDYITAIPESLIGELLKDFVKPDYSKQLEFETKKLIAAGANLDHVHFIIQEIARLSSQFMESPFPISDLDRNLYHRLVDVSRLVPLQNLVTVILQNYQNPEAEDLKIVLGLLGTYRIEVDDETSLYLQEKTRKDLRDLLCRYSNLILKTDDFSGALKADLSCAMALFGQPEDIAVIKELVAKDIERVRNGRKARKGGIRNSSQVNGCSTSWAGWHIRAILKVHSDEIEGFLIQLLNEPEYENDAANGLAQLLWKEVPKEKQRIVFHDPLIIGSLKWREEYIDSAKRKKYAQAIVQRINDKRKKDSCCAPKTLAGHLAKLNDPDTIPIILEILEVPQQFDAWRRLHPLEMLVRNGHCLETSTVEAVIRPAIEQSLDVRMSGKQETYLLVQCLCILVCSNDVGKAVSIIDEILTKHKLWYELRGLIETLGNRKTSEATEYLIHLCQDKRLYNSLGYELIEALGKTELPEAKEALLSTIDDSISSPKIPMPNRNGRSNLSQALSNICKSDESVQKRIIYVCNEQSVSKEQIEIILSVINISPSNEAIIAAISMLSRDNNKSSIPYELKSAVEKSVIQHVPIDDIPGGYNILPRINKELSMNLFESVINKKVYCLIAFDLLGYINWLRIEYGRPQLEARHPDIRTQKPWPPLNVD